MREQKRSLIGSVKHLDLAMPEGVASLNFLAPEFHWKTHPASKIPTKAPPVFSKHQFPLNFKLTEILRNG